MAGGASRGAVITRHDRRVNTAAGYRLVRRLGHGQRADVWLGHADGGSDNGFAVKQFHAGVPPRSIEIEAESLSRIESAHVVRLHDLGTSPGGGGCLVLQRLAPGGLSRIVASRATLEPGEVVTALAPVAHALGALHRAGVAHGAVSLATILLDASGAPVLACFGNARIVASPSPTGLSPAQLLADPHIQADVTAFLALAASLIDRCRPTPQSARLGQWLASADVTAAHLDDLAGHLFDLAPATPLRTIQVEPESIPQRLGDPVDAATHFEVHSLESEHIERGSSSSWLAALGLPAWLEQHIDGAPIAALRQRVTAAASTVRRPVWIAGGAGLAALVLAIGLLSTSPGGQHPVAPAPTAVARTPVSSAATGDDPVAATDALMAARQKCFDDLAPSCLEVVDQAGSALLDTDRASIASLRQGGRQVQENLQGRTARLVQRLGDTAIMSLEPAGTTGTPVSALVVKDTSGWRLRDVIAG